MVITLNNAPQAAEIRQWAATGPSHSLAGRVNGRAQVYATVANSEQGVFSGATEPPLPREAAEPSSDPRTPGALRWVGSSSGVEKRLRRVQGNTLRQLPKPRRLATEYEPHFIHPDHGEATVPAYLV